MVNSEERLETLASRPHKGKLGDINRHQQRLRHSRPLAVVRVHSTGHRHFDSLDFSVVVLVVRTAGAAEDINGVVVSSHESVRTEMGDLLATV